MQIDTGIERKFGQNFEPVNLRALFELPAAFIELLPVAAYACDAAGRILWFNRRAAEMWGRAPRIGDDTELFCGSYRLYFGGRCISRTETPMAVAIRTGEPIGGVEGIVERPDGSRIWATVHIAPVKDAAGEVLGAVNCFHDTTELHAARAEVAEREAYTRRILEALPAAVYTTDAAGRITYYNPAAAELAGREPTLGSDEWCVTWKLYRPDGSPLPHDECPMALALREKRPNSGMEAIAERPDGTRVPFMPYPTPLFDAGGELAGAVNMLVDITERKRHEEHQKLLVNELNHRVKNTLSIVQSMAMQTLRNSREPGEAGRQIEARLIALAKAHDILTRESWEGASLMRIVDETIAPHDAPGSSRFDIAGPEVRLPPKHALALAMVLHELCTNAVKYGALSNDRGRVGIAWSATGNGSRILRVHWAERDGPAVKRPAHMGFGSRLIKRGLGQDAGSDVRLDFAETGLVCTLTAPLPPVA